MRALAAAFASWVSLAGISWGQTNALQESQLREVEFEQHLGQALPLSLPLNDEAGAAVRLGSYFDGKPVILALVYYECPNLCNIVLNAVLESVRNLRESAGKDYQIVIVSIDPTETAKLAAAKKEVYTLRYGRTDPRKGWHFLTGNSDAISRLSDAVGFRYRYDAASGQYAHPSGIVVATPEGAISKYMLGIEYPPRELHAVLQAAGKQSIGSPASRLLLLCFHYDPATGKYTPYIRRLLQAAGIGTVLVLGLLMIRLNRNRNRGAMLSVLPLVGSSASNLSVEVDLVFYVLLALCTLVTLGIALAVLYFCVRYRAGAKQAPQIQPNRRSLAVEITWTSLTMAAFLGIFVWAAIVYFRMSAPPADAAVIYVVGKQWMWKIQHPNGRREIDELHLLVNQPVRLLMRSQDVIHDFYIPAFRTKQDVLPDRYTQEWFIPTKPGRYRIFCAEYCGTHHSGMRGWVHVLTPTEYAQWLAGATEGNSMAEAGAKIFVARGCSGCHSAQSVVRSPPLNGIYGRPVALQDGTVVIADEQYLHDSILLPNKQVAAGYEAKMPTFQGQLGEEDLMQLIAYIKSLASTSGGTP